MRTQVGHAGRIDHGLLCDFISLLNKSKTLLNIISTWVLLTRAAVTEILISEDLSQNIHISRCWRDCTRQPPAPIYPYSDSRLSCRVSDFVEINGLSGA